MFDAYTIRKIAPRLLLAAVGINLSFYLCVVAIDITNVVGGGLGDMLRGPFVDANSFSSVPKFEQNFEGGVVGVVGAGFAAYMIANAWVAFNALGAVETMGMLLIAIAPLALVAIAILATIVLRYGAIIFLTIVSPVAIALMVLPGTEKYFKQWREIFIKVLIMYPIIAAIFAISDVMGSIFLNEQRNVGDILSTVSIFVVLIAVYAPLFMIPFAFKMAGGVLGQIYDFANNQGVKGVSGRLGKWKEDPNSWYGGKRGKVKQSRQQAGVTGGQIMSGINGGIRSRSRGGSFRAGYTSNLQRSQKMYDAAKKAEEENEAINAIGSDDDQLHALKLLASGGSATEAESLLKRIAPDRFDQSRGGSEVALQEALAQVQRAHGQLGSQVAGSIAIKRIAQTKTGWTDSVEMMKDINSVAGGDRALASRLLADSLEGQKNAGRIDNSGFGYTVGVHELEQFRKGPQNGETEAQFDNDRRTSLRNAMFDKTSAGTIATMHERGMKVTVDGMLDELKEAQQFKTEAIRTGAAPEIVAGADMRIQRATAKLANTYDAAQYAHPLNAEMIADNVLSQNVGYVGANGQVLNVREMIEQMRGRPEANPEFANMRRDFQQSEMEARQNAGQGQAGVGPTR